MESWKPGTPCLTRVSQTGTVALGMCSREAGQQNMALSPAHQGQLEEEAWPAHREPLVTKHSSPLAYGFSLLKKLEALKLDCQYGEFESIPKSGANVEKIQRNYTSPYCSISTKIKNKLMSSA